MKSRRSRRISKRRPKKSSPSDELTSSPPASSLGTSPFRSSVLTPSKRKVYDNLDNLLKQYEGKRSFRSRLTKERSDIDKIQEKVIREEEKTGEVIKSKLKDLKEGIEEGEEQIEELETELSGERDDLRELNKDIEDIEKYLADEELGDPEWRYVEDDNAKRADDDDDDLVREKLSSPVYLVFIVIIIVGIIINLHLLYRLKGKDRNGRDIPRDRRDMAAVNGLGLAIILGIIFGGAIYLSRSDGYITNQGSALVILILISFIVIFLMGLFMGEYIMVGHIWTPIQPLKSPHDIIL